MSAASRLSRRFSEFPKSREGHHIPHFRRSAEWDEAKSVDTSVDAADTSVRATSGSHTFHDLRSSASRRGKHECLRHGGGQARGLFYSFRVASEASKAIRTNWLLVRTRVF